MRRERFRELARAWPEVVERYGIRPAAPRIGSWAHCRRCELYFTRNVDDVSRCPLCGYGLRHGPRKGKKRRRCVNPEEYGVEVE